MSSPISGFTAIPNPYMIPLLFLQSLLIGAGFGIGYQGERRKLSAMSNEKFNDTDLGMHAFNQFKEILARNDFGQMLDLMHPLTKQLAEAFGQFLNQLPENVASVAKEATGGLNLFASSALVGSPSGTSIGGQATADFQKYLELLRKLKEPEKTFTGPTQRTDQQYSGPVGPNLPTNYMSMQLEHLLRIPQKSLSTAERFQLNKAIKSKTPAPKTQEEIRDAINISSTGNVNKIASLYNDMQIQMKKYFINRSRGINSFPTALLNTMKAYNRFVQSIGKTNLVVDTGLSIKKKRFISKT